MLVLRCCLFLNFVFTCTAELKQFSVFSHDGTVWTGVGDVTTLDHSPILQMTVKKVPENVSGPIDSSKYAWVQLKSHADFVGLLKSDLEKRRQPDQQGYIPLFCLLEGTDEIYLEIMFLKGFGDNILGEGHDGVNVPFVYEEFATLWLKQGRVFAQNHKGSIVPNEEAVAMGFPSGTQIIQIRFENQETQANTVTLLNDNSVDGFLDFSALPVDDLTLVTLSACTNNVFSKRIWIPFCFRDIDILLDIGTGTNIPGYRGNSGVQPPELWFQQYGDDKYHVSPGHEVRNSKSEKMIFTGTKEPASMSQEITKLNVYDLKAGNIKTTVLVYDLPLVAVKQ